MHDVTLQVFSFLVNRQIQEISDLFTRFQDFNSYARSDHLLQPGSKPVLGKRE